MGIIKIDKKYIDSKYYYFHKAINDCRILLHIPFEQGDFYFTYGLDDDTERRALMLMATEKCTKSIKSQQAKDKKNGNKLFPPECNRITSAPCAWSYTHWSTERCRKCGYVFPEWN